MTDEELQAEVERLNEALATMTEVAAEHQRREWEAKAQNEAMRPFVEVLANFDRMEVEDGTCPFCGLVDWEHRDAPHPERCLVTKARATLAQP